jgi:acyl carrier protein
MVEKATGPAAGRMGEIRSIAVEELELDMPPEELDEDAHLVTTYGADSLALIQVFSRIERELGVVIPQEDKNRLTTLRAIAETIDR